MKLSKYLALFLVTTTAAMASVALAEENFEIIDGSARISGSPNTLSQQARQNWQAACDNWKQETKDLNQSNQVMMMSCQSPVCEVQDDQYTCTSQAVFKVKTAGVRVAQPPQETVVETAPPPVIVETVPAARPGFLWIGGYWGWRLHRHYWYPGHWETHRVGYTYVRPMWEHHPHGWRFVAGRWSR